MNSTQIRSTFKTFLALLLVVLFTNQFVFAKRASSEAMASLASPQPQIAYLVSDAVSFYTKKQQKQKLSENEINILKLSLLAQDVFEIKDFLVYAHLSTEKEKIESITPTYIARAIQQTIEKKPDWESPLSNSNIEKLKENSELLKKNLNEASLSWAWINYQIGQKQEAKNILTSKFETSYAYVMKLQETYNHDRSPLHESERISKILKLMSTEDENKTREDQLKKMRTHVSGLRDVQIMT